MSEKHHKSSWKSKSTFRTKPWGSEIHWHAIGTINGKCLRISKGKKTSLKYYSLKDEVLFLYRGKIRVQHGDESTLENPRDFPWKYSILLPGELINVQSGCPYRIEALEDSEVIEIGSRGSNDPIRIEDDYGREVNKKLSSLFKKTGEKDASS